MVGDSVYARAQRTLITLADKSEAQHLLTGLNTAGRRIPLVVKAA